MTRLVAAPVPSVDVRGDAASRIRFSIFTKDTLIKTF
jgi:hypothetical protein